MQLHFEHYLKELCDIYIDVLGKCQYSGFAGYVEELEQRKKGISFSIKSNFKEILSSLPYVQKVESLNKRFPGFKYLTDVFFNDEDSFSQLSQARLNFHSMEFIVGENERRKVFTIDKKTTFICYLLSFFANHAKLKDSKNILDVIDKLKSSILQEGENATLISDLLKSAFSIYFRFPPLKKRALLLYLDLIKFLGENPLTSQSVVNNILNKKVIIQYKKGTISLKELFFLLTKTNQNVKEKSYLNLLRQSLIKEGIIQKFYNVQFEKTVDFLRIFQNVRYLNETEFCAAINAMDFEKLKHYDFSLAQRILPRLLVRLSKEKNAPITFEKAVETIRTERANLDIWQENKHWLAQGALSLAEVFGIGFDGYLNKTKPFLNLHDSIFFLTDMDYGNPKNKQLGVFLKNNVIYQDENNVKHVRAFHHLSTIIHSWAKQELQGNEGFNRILNLSVSNYYENVKNENFAKEASFWRVPSENYSDIENIYLTSKSVAHPFDCSKRWLSGNFVGRFLPRDDVRVGFFGHYTGCCQHFTGAGKLAAISSVKDDFSSLFVIEKDGLIVAGSLVWQAKENPSINSVCFDSVECLRAYRESPEIFDIYQQVHTDLKKKYEHITFGANPFTQIKAEKCLPIPQNIYTDAGVQFVLDEKQKQRD